MGPQNFVMVRMRYGLAILLNLMGINLALAQEYEVYPAPFNHWERATFCPVWYQNKIVFCGDRHEDDKMSFFYGTSNQETTGIFIVDPATGKADILAEELSTKFSDGPISFVGDESMCFFSSNMQQKNHTGERKGEKVSIGIFSAVMSNGKWTNKTGFPHNSTQYNFVHPAISKSGRTLYFASNIPGGMGGFDIYFSTLTNSGWSVPVNAGPGVNSSANEQYPSWGGTSVLFFSSDREGGYGGLDIFKFDLTDSKSTCIRFPDPINGPNDDFGLLTDGSMKVGYFSSNRHGNDKVYSFRVEETYFEDCDTLTQPDLCYMFTDDNAEPLYDGLRYEWDMGDGTRETGITVSHCFKAPGEYDIKLAVIDVKTERVVKDVASYHISLSAPNQPVINGPAIARAGEEVQGSARFTYGRVYKIVLCRIMRKASFICPLSIGHYC